MSSSLQESGSFGLKSLLDIGIPSGQAALTAAQVTLVRTDQSICTLPLASLNRLRLNGPHTRVVPLVMVMAASLTAEDPTGTGVFGSSRVKTVGATPPFSMMSKVMPSLLKLSSLAAVFMVTTAPVIPGLWAVWSGILLLSGRSSAPRSYPGQVGIPGGSTRADGE